MSDTPAVLPAGISSEVMREHLTRHTCGVGDCTARAFTCPHGNVAWAVTCPACGNPLVVFVTADCECVPELGDLEMWA